MRSDQMRGELVVEFAGLPWLVLACVMLRRGGGVGGSGVRGCLEAVATMMMMMVVMVVRLVATKRNQ